MTSHFDTLNLDLGQRQTFPSIGRCIYCGSTNGKLTDEHIVPRGLTGNAVVFKKAVCEPCRLLTHPYEDRVLRKMYGKLRVQMDTPTSRPKERSDILSHRFVLLDETGTVSIGEHIVHRRWDASPVACLSWLSPEPGYLRGQQPSKLLEGVQWATCPAAKAFTESVRSEIGYSGPIGYHVGDVLARDYLRFIAKVTHGYAVATFGFDAFEHWLVPIILGDDEAVSHLVGGNPEVQPAVANGGAIRIDFGHPTDGLEVLVAQVRLFEFLGTPTHLVVVGKAPPEELPRRLPLDKHGRAQ